MKKCWVCIDLAITTLGKATANSLLEITAFCSNWQHRNFYLTFSKKLVECGHLGPHCDGFCGTLGHPKDARLYHSTASLNGEEERRAQASH